MLAETKEGHPQKVKKSSKRRGGVIKFPELLQEGNPTGTHSKRKYPYRRYVETIQKTELGRKHQMREESDRTRLMSSLEIKLRVLKCTSQDHDRSPYLEYKDKR